MKMTTFQTEHWEGLLKDIDASREKILRKYFNKVCNADDWKKPIDGTCDVIEKYLVETAIMYYTGTKAKFVPVLDTNDLKVTALGYRMGPCGP